MSDMPDIHSRIEVGPNTQISIGIRDDGHIVLRVKDEEQCTDLAFSWRDAADVSDALYKAVTKSALDKGAPATFEVVVAPE